LRAEEAERAAASVAVAAPPVAEARGGAAEAPPSPAQLGALLSSVVHTASSSGAKSLSLGRLSLVLVAAQQATSARLEAEGQAHEAAAAAGLSASAAALGERLDEVTALLLGDAKESRVGGGEVGAAADGSGSGSGGLRGRAENLEERIAKLEAAAKERDAENAAAAAAAAAAEAAAAADGSALAAARSEGEALRRYFLDEVGRIEAALRSARISTAAAASAAQAQAQASGGGDPVGAAKLAVEAAALEPLSARDKSAAREQAMAAVKERQADLKALRGTPGL